MPPATIRFRALPDSERWTSAHRMKLMFIGCRVIANTPRGGEIDRGGPAMLGKAGLRISEPISRMLAKSIRADATGHHQSGATQKGTPGSGQAQIIQPSVANAISE
jgi:hypothetical protein